MAALSHAFRDLMPRRSLFSVTILLSLLPSARLSVMAESTTALLSGPIAYHVATNGNGDNAGTIDQPWRTTQKAADAMVAGDIVLVRVGAYPAPSLR
jgi:hypothetical protein